MNFSYRIQGILLACKHCGNGGFDRLRAEDARGGGSGSSNLELSDGRDTVVFACSTCGFLHWFVECDSIEEIPDETACLECGATIPGEASACPSCGWTWKPARSS